MVSHSGPVKGVVMSSTTDKAKGYANKAAGKLTQASPFWRVMAQLFIVVSERQTPIRSYWHR
jgi:hypothetical protein